jgi:hypothetical protein
MMGDDVSYDQAKNSDGDAARRVVAVTVSRVELPASDSAGQVGRRWSPATTRTPSRSPRVQLDLALTPTSAGEPGPAAHPHETHLSCQGCQAEKRVALDDPGYGPTVRAFLDDHDDCESSVVFHGSTIDAR